MNNLTVLLLGFIVFHSTSFAEQLAQAIPQVSSRQSTRSPIEQPYAKLKQCLDSSSFTVGYTLCEVKKQKEKTHAPGCTFSPKERTDIFYKDTGYSVSTNSITKKDGTTAPLSAVTNLVNRSFSELKDNLIDFMTFEDDKKYKRKDVVELDFYRMVKSSICTCYNNNIEVDAINEAVKELIDNPAIQANTEDGIRTFNKSDFECMSATS